MCRVRFEFANLARHRDDRLLHDFLRLAVRQPGFDRDVVNQARVGVEKVLPARLIAPVLEPVEQAVPRWNWIEQLSWHKSRR